jgi:hypothetical protein
MPKMFHNFALSQTPRCAEKSSLPIHNLLQQPLLTATTTTKPATQTRTVRTAIWRDCDMEKENSNELSLMGYSMRTNEYRYTVYFYYDRKSHITDFKSLPYSQELYDHKNETLADFTHRETFNLAIRPAYTSVINNLREKLIKFVQESISNYK